MTIRTPDPRFEKVTPREIRDEAARLAEAAGNLDLAHSIRRIPLVKVRPI